jgi:hypothetical protein
MSMFDDEEALEVLRKIDLHLMRIIELLEQSQGRALYQRKGD